MREGVSIRRSPKCKARACLLLWVLGLAPLACGDGGNHNTDQQTLDAALSELERFTPIHLDTAALALAVRAGQPIQLPFERQGGEVVERQVQLTLRNLRSPDLTEFVLKDGDAESGSSVPLPPPATYQGMVQARGVAVFTITDEAVEGRMLGSPDGWSFIEPLNPELRLRNVARGARHRLLERYNHIVYNARDAHGGAALNDNPVSSPPVQAPPQPPAPLVMSMVADGDAVLYRA